MQERMVTINNVELRFVNWNSWSSWVLKGIGMMRMDENKLSMVLSAERISDINKSQIKGQY